MSSRPLIIASLLGASIGMPYVASRVPTGWLPAAGPEATPATTTAETSRPPVSSPAALPHVSPAPPREGTRFHAIEQVLRFDLTKEWVYRTWDRKSTGPTDVGLLGVRVPLVTGTQPAALAGSLTYFFNPHGQIEHISFRGRTGDPAALVNFLVRTYEFQPAAAPVSEQVYQVTRRGRVQSELRTRPEPVLRNASPQSNYAVELELARPGTRRYLPPRGPQLQIPQVTSPALTPREQATAAAEGGSFLDRARYATPQEKDHVLWKRWPN